LHFTRRFATRFQKNFTKWNQSTSIDGDGPVCRLRLQMVAFFCTGWGSLWNNYILAM